MQKSVLLRSLNKDFFVKFFIHKRRNDNMGYYKKIIGDRIYLSPLNVEDAEKLTDWLNDFKVADGLGKSGELVNVHSYRQWLEKNLSNNEMNLAIVNLENDELIGNGAFMDISYLNRIATLGIFIGKEENRSKGYGTEAVRLMLDYGFNYLNLNNIMLQVKSFNERAISCYKRVGFKEFGRRRESYFLGAKYYDDVMMVILAREFEGSYIRNRNI
jgi:RimJ/RimL family protein N-acetyltransferase